MGLTSQGRAKVPSMAKSLRGEFSLRLLLMIRSRKIAVVAPLAVGLDPGQEHGGGTAPLHDLEVVDAELLIMDQVLGTNPTGADEVDRRLHLGGGAADGTIVQVETFAAVTGLGGVGRHVHVHGRHVAAHEAGVVDQELQVALDRLPQAPQQGKIPVAGDVVQADTVCTLVHPELGPLHRIDLGEDADTDAEVVITLDRTQQHGVIESKSGDPDFSQPVQQLADAALARAGVLEVVEAGGVEQVVEIQARPPGEGHVRGQATLAHAGQGEGGAAAPRHIPAQLAIDLMDRIGLDPLQQGGIEVAGHA